MDSALTLVVEDVLSETVLRHLIERTTPSLAITRCIPARGSGRIESRIRSYNDMARTFPCVVMLDLDTRDCAAGYVQRLLPDGLARWMVLRIAVREVESWILADAHGFAEFTGVARSVIPRDPDTLPDAKEALLNVVRRSRKRSLKEAMLPKFAGSSQGPEYNAEIGRLVATLWDVHRAAGSSPSLARAIAALERLDADIADHFV